MRFFLLYSVGIFLSLEMTLKDHFVQAIPPVTLPQITSSDSSTDSPDVSSDNPENADDSSDIEPDLEEGLSTPPPLENLPPPPPGQQELTAQPTQEFEPLISQKNNEKSAFVARPYTKEQRKEEEDIDPNVTCTDLIQGTLDATGDGRANLVCEQAMERCLAQESIDKLIKDGQSPWSARDTKKLANYILRESIKWRRLCEASRITTADSQFLTTYFQRMKKKTSEQKRPLSRAEKALRKLKQREKEVQEIVKTVEEAENTNPDQGQ